MNDIINTIISNIEKVIYGKRDVIRNLLKAIIAEGHVLIEDIPGIGKTSLVKALAQSLDLAFSRIQFTPDLLPSDITGISIFNPKSKKFDFKQGPVFTNILLADEINRTSPKTQSALLEVMEERQVTEGGTTMPMDTPFIVIATQNPIEYEGTFKLPEAQLDRFIMKIGIGYVDQESEMDIIRDKSKYNNLSELGSITDGSQLAVLQEKRSDVLLSEPILRYISTILQKTRDNELLVLGASTRAGLALARIAQASALMDDRDFVKPEDVKLHVAPVLAHRLILSSLARSKNIDQETVLQEVLENTAIPGL